MKNTSSNEALPKAYTAKEHEDLIYQEWFDAGFFNPDNLPQKTGKPYSIMMPPPNVTGILHLGHALEQTLLDAKIRFERMRGRRALLIPGVDHAAVATQARVEKDLIEKGHTRPREEFGREKLLQIIREYAGQSKETIIAQIKKMGTSCDWDRFAYTFDEQRSRAVYTAFKSMYDDGLIYRGYRVVNWSVVGQSTASDDELEYIEREAQLYTFKYSKDFPIPVATTRPESKVGDTAVAVNPKDKRYAQYIGKTFTADIGAAQPLSIKIIADPAVDPDFGTGAVGVTPAHSMIDFEMKERHGLDLIQVIGTDGMMTEAAGTYAGLSVEKARQKFVAWLKKEKLLISEETIKQNVATHERFNDVIEVVPMLQWFVGVNKPSKKLKGKTLKDLMRAAGEKIEIKPERYKTVYYQWIDNLWDWCISRQIWWGHRIPVWYKDAEVRVSIESPGAGWVQDPDTLDTWFSSGTWTFSTLGWPEKTKDLKTFHPSVWMQMGYEIVFFWMARMILMSEYMLQDIPFKEVYIHGLVRDKDGRKFSKSLRNTLDPLEMIAKYGTDALRMSLVSGVTPGNDLTFSEEKVEHYQHFVNKLWNISRYVLSSVDTVSVPAKTPKPETQTDQWIFKKLHSLISDMTKLLEQSDFSLAAAALYEFTWNDFADWYIEVAKVEAKRSEQAKQQKDQMLLFILDALLRLAHPFMPFVTEVLWKQLSPKDLLMVSDWPTISFDRAAEADEVFSQVQEVITSIRENKSVNKIPPATMVKVSMPLPYPQYRDVIEKLARCTIEISKDPTIMVASVSTLTEAKREELKAYIDSLEKKLATAAFTKNAPAAVVAQERKKLADAQAKLTE